MKSRRSIKCLSGYSGGHVENPTYQEVVLGNTGHIEAAEINYDSSLVNEEQLVKLLFLKYRPFWIKVVSFVIEDILIKVHFYK